MTPTRLRVLAFSGILIAIFLPHLTDFNYGFGSFEMTAFTVGSIVIGAVLGVVCRKQILFGFVLGYLLYIFIDSYFLDPRWAISCLVISCLLTPVLLRQMPHGLPLAVFLFGCVFGLPSYFYPSDPILIIREAAADSRSSEGPDFAYLHIILDEQLSPTANHPSVPSIAGRQEVIDTYVEHDFRLYGRADSEAQETYLALSALFGLGEDTTNFDRLLGATPYKYAVHDNQLITQLLDAGFTPTVIDSSYLGLCGDDPRVTCKRYNISDMKNPAESLGWQLARRMQYALIALNNNYIWGGRILLGYREIPIQIARLLDWQYEPYESMMAPVTSLSLLEDLSSSVADLQHGDALIAHLLVPHRPFVLDRDCNLKALSGWRYPLFRNETEMDVSIYEAFWDQSICTHRRLEVLLQATDGRDDLVVFVHGDHGSRILSKTVLNTQIDNRATLLAVKAPEFEPGLVASTVPLQATFAEMFQAILDGDHTR